MGSVCGGRIDETTRRIDKELQQDRKKSETIKVLLLGTGESGKSTVMKQMQILYDNGFSDTEKDAFRTVLRRNAFDAMQTLVRQVTDSDFPWPTQELEMGATLLSSWDSSSQQFWTDQVLKIIRLFWANDEVRSWCLQRNKHPPFQLIDSASYLFDNVDRIWASEFIPTEVDILRARLRTSGVVERIVSTNFSIPFKFVDVGGQKNERRKWMSCFNDVTAVIYVCAVSEYDQTLFEDEKTNRVEDSLEVFQSVVSPPTSHFTDRTAILVFLNKIDILETKIQQSRLSKYFPNFNGPETAEAALEFFQKEFRQRAGGRSLYVHSTCATDTKAFQTVFDRCKAVITKGILKDIGLVSVD